MDLIDKYLGEETVCLNDGKNLTKKQVFGALTRALASGEWKNIDDIAKEAQFPMSTHGLQAHMMELVRKGKAKESMKRGKYIYKMG